MATEAHLSTRSPFYVEDWRARPNKFHLECPSDALRDRLVQDLKLEMERAVAEFPEPARQFFVIRMINVLADPILEIFALTNVERLDTRVEKV